MHLKTNFYNVLQEEEVLRKVDDGDCSAEDAGNNDAIDWSKAEEERNDRLKEKYNVNEISITVIEEEIRKIKIFENDNKDNNIKGENEDTDKERELINARSNKIAKVLLGKHYLLHERVSYDFEVTDYSLRNLQILHYELKQDFKEKEQEWLNVICASKEKII